MPRCEGREIHLLRRGYFLCFDIFLKPAIWLVWNSWFDQVLIKHWFDYIFFEIFCGFNTTKILHFAAASWYRTKVRERG